MWCNSWVDEMVEVVSAAPIEAADRFLTEWAASLGIELESLAEDLVDDTTRGPSGDPLFRSFLLRRAKAAEVYASADKPTPMTQSQVVGHLASTASAVRNLVDEQVEDNGEVLLHPFVARCRDLAIDALERGESDLSARIVAALDDGLREGDAAVANAIAVSFVEDTPLWDPDRRDFIESWPQALQPEAQRQRRAGS